MNRSAVNLDQVTLNFKTFGEGPPLIILHGLFGMLDNWKSIGTELAKDFSVYLVDIRNHGRSPHYPSHTYSDIAADLNQWMEEQWLYEATLIGHSMGGKAAIQYAYDYPENLEKLIIVDIAPKTYTGGHETIIQALQSIPIDKVESRGEVEESLQTTIKDRGVILFLLKNLTRKKEGGFKWKMNLPVIAESYTTEIMASPDYQDTIDVDTLFVNGALSDYITSEDLPLLDKLFTNYRLKSCPDAGHWVHADKPQELISLFKEFILE